MVLKVETSLDYLFKEMVLPAQESPVLAFLAIFAACIVSFLSEYSDVYKNALWAVSGLILVKSIAEICLKLIDYTQNAFTLELGLVLWELSIL